MDNKNFRYYAFISYAHEDETWAEWLHKEVESYKLPATIHKDYAKELPNRVQPLFRDMSDLAAGGDLDKTLKQELEDSNYLIIVCSPNSAKSEWVNKEVQHFIDMGREDRIIPFIVDGKPNCSDEEIDSECFSPAIRGKDILGASVNDVVDIKTFNGKDKKKIAKKNHRIKTSAKLKIIAGLLNVKLDVLIRRHEQEEKKKKKRKIRILAICAVLLSLISFFVFDYNRYKVKYYENYVEVYGIAEGINQLDKPELKQYEYCYRITKHRYRTISVEMVNAQGQIMHEQFVFNHYGIESKPKIIKYFYNERKLDYTVYYANENSVIMQLDYVDDGDNDKNTAQINLYASPNSDDQNEFSWDRDAIQAHIGATYVEPEGVPEICKFRVFYDENGWMIKRQYMNAARKPRLQEDIHGVAGEIYEYTEEGRLAKKTFINTEGEVTKERYSDVASILFTYDDDLKQITYTNIYNNIVENPDKYACAQIYKFFDGETLLKQKEILYEANLKEIADTDIDYNVLYNFYNDDGLVDRIYRCRYDSIWLPKSQENPHKHEIEYDNNYRVSKISIFQQNGELFTNDYKYPVIEYDYVNDSNAVKQRKYYDINSETNELELSLKALYFYNKKGRIEDEVYIDKDDNIHFKYLYTYYEGKIAYMIYADANDIVVDYGEDYNSIIYIYDDRMNLIQKAYCDIEAGADIKNIYEEADLEGEIVPSDDIRFVDCQDGFSYVKYQYTSRGLLFKQEYYNQEDEIVMPYSKEYAKRELEYNEDNLLVREQFYDEYDDFGTGDDYCVYLASYDELMENERYLLSYIDRSDKVKKYITCNKDYDEQGRLVEEVYVTEETDPTDRYGFFRKNSFYNDDKLKTTIKGYFYTDDYKVYEVSKYDDEGNCIETRYIDKMFNPIIGEYGYEKAEKQYSSNNTLKTETYYGEESYYTGEIYKTVVEYDNKGRVVSTAHYNKDDKLQFGYYSTNTHTKYNDDGSQVLTEENYVFNGYPVAAKAVTITSADQQTEENYFLDENNEYLISCGSGSEAYSRRIINRNIYGEIVEMVYYDYLIYGVGYDNPITNSQKPIHKAVITYNEDESITVYYDENDNVIYDSSIDTKENESSSFEPVSPTFTVNAKENIVFASQSLLLKVREELRILNGEITRAELNSLKSLDLSDCGILDYSDLKYLTGLEELDIMPESLFWGLDSLTYLKNLKTLRISGGNIKDSDLVYIFKLSQLETLHIQDCENIRDITNISSLSNLKSLDLSYSANLTDASALSSLTKLESLDLAGCENITNIDFLKDLTQLKEADFTLCNSIAYVPWIGNLDKLESLSLSLCEGLNNIDNILRLNENSLKSLSLPPFITNNDIVKVSAAFPTLEELDIIWCENLTHVDELASLTNLKKLNLMGCYNLENIDGLSNLVQLNHLDFRFNYKLKSIDSISSLNQLEFLDLFFCSNLTYVDALASLINLEYLDLSFCTEVSFFEPLASLYNMRELTITKCHNLSSIDFLKNMGNVEKLEITIGDSINDISVIAGLHGLKELFLEYRLNLSKYDIFDKYADFEVLVELSDTIVIIDRFVTFN